MSLIQKDSCADLSTLLCSHYLKGKLTKLQVQSVCMKKRENEEFEREVVAAYIIVAVLG